MLFRRQFSLPILVAISVLPLARAVPFSELIVDDVDIYLSLRSAAESRESWVEHPFSELLQDPELQSFFEPWIGMEGGTDSEEDSITEILENEFDLSWDELFELFPGQSAVGLYNLTELLLKQETRPDLSILLEYEGERDRLYDLLQVQFERNAERHKAANPDVEHTLIEESFMGETLYFDEVFDGESTYIEDGYALVDGVFVLATPESRLRSTVESIKERSDSALAESSAYLRSREKGSRGDFELYFNLEPLLSTVNETFLRKAVAGGAAMFGVSAQSLDAALSLGTLKALFLHVDFIAEGIGSNSGIIYREKAGLLDLMAYSRDPLPEARYVPDSVFSSSISNFDLGEMFAQLENFLVTASPIMRMQIDGQLQAFRSNTGVDLRSAVLENFGSGMVTLSRWPNDQRGGDAAMSDDQVVVIELEDAVAFSGALEALKDLQPGIRDQIDTQDFAGETINSVPLGNPGMASGSGGQFLRYVITRSELIVGVGGLGLLQEVLSSIEAGDEGFWQRAETEALFEKIEERSAITRSYFDMEKLVAPIFQSMVKASQMGPGSGALDSSRIPANLEIPLHLAYEVNEEDDGFYTRALILQK